MLATMFWLPKDISVHGYQIDRLIEWMHYFMGVLFVGWGIFFLYCLFRFRARTGHGATYELIKAKPSKYVEVAVIVVEAVLMIWFSMPAWAEYKNDPPRPEENPLEVRVLAQQFAWNFQYPGPDGKFGRRNLKYNDETTNPVALDPTDPDGKDDVVEINNLYIPKNRPVMLHLSTKDVIHSFAIPVLRVKQDIIPGMSIPIWFTARETGEYDIQCAQLCGLGHYRMRGAVRIKEAADFETWYKTAKQDEEFSEDE